MERNIDESVVSDFGHEWNRFDQSKLDDSELENIFSAYFSVFDWNRLPENATGFDLGCGSGRWAKLVAKRVGELHCIDPSSAIEVARRNLSESKNCHFHKADVDNIPLEDGSMDFGYSLGVLHHIPDTGRGIESCVKKIKPGAPFLIYLYYAFDNKPRWFKIIWGLTEYVRSVISILPTRLKEIICQVIAILVYFPLARIARVFEKLGKDVENFPLSVYRNRSLYVMRTDALDRFGTRLEKRFSRAEIELMMRNAGLEGIKFNDKPPYWCAVGYRTASRPHGGV